MWRIRRARGPSRILAAVALTLLTLLGSAACGHTKGKPISDQGTDQKVMDAIALQIRTALAERPDVVNAEVSYQNTFDASERADATIKVKGGTDFAPVLDDAVRLIWQSKLSPVSSINVSVIDADNLQRADVRRVNLLDKDEKARLEAKYGARPE